MNIAIEHIEIGERRREDYGDVAGLAASIRRYGLIHPLVIDSDNRLIAGGRRLEAARILGWKEIAARDFGSLTQQERQEIELEENLRRKDLTEWEQSRELVRKAASVAPVISGNLPEKDARGRKPIYEAPKEDIAKAISTSKRELVRAEQHVDTAETYPFMQKPEWRQYHVLEAKETLHALPEPDRAAIAPMLSEPGVPPAAAIEILKNVAGMQPDKRQEIFRLYKSEDPREVSLAKTRASEQPPSPDPRVIVLGDVLDGLRRSVRKFPGDEFNERIAALAESVSTLIKDISARHKEKTSEQG